MWGKTVRGRGRGMWKFRGAPHEQWYHGSCGIHVHRYVMHARLDYRAMSQNLSANTLHLDQSSHYWPPSQTNIPTFCSQRTLSIITTGTLMIIKRPYPSQSTPPNWHTPSEKEWLNTLHGLFHRPKAHLYVITLTHFLVFDTMSYPLFFRVTKIGSTKARGFLHKQIFHNLAHTGFQFMS